MSVRVTLVISATTVFLSDVSKVTLDQPRTCDSEKNTRGKENYREANGTAEADRGRRLDRQCLDMHCMSGLLQET